MARKQAGRAAAERAFADLYRAQREAVGDVGEEWEKYRQALVDAEDQRQVFEKVRSEKVQDNVVTSGQLDQLGYKKTTALALPTLPTEEDGQDGEQGSSGRQRPGSKTRTKTAVGGQTDAQDAAAGSDSLTEAPSDREPASVG